jgi:hypothetical protein
MSNYLTVEKLMRTWNMDRTRAEEVLAEHERHFRECPCGGEVKGHRAGWRYGDKRSPVAVVGYCSWHDHLSTARVDGRTIYEAQPYATDHWGVDLDEAETDFAKLRAAGWTVTVDREASRHVPGETILVVCVPPAKVKRAR